MYLNFYYGVADTTGFFYIDYSIVNNFSHALKMECDFCVCRLKSEQLWEALPVMASLENMGAKLPFSRFHVSSSCYPNFILFLKANISNCFYAPIT